MNLESILRSVGNVGAPGSPVPASGRAGGRMITGQVAGSSGRGTAIGPDGGAPPGATGLTREQLEARVEAENAYLATLNQKLRFRVHEGTGQLLVQVVDRNTGDVLRESPPAEFLDLAVRIREMVGAFLDETS